MAENVIKMVFFLGSLSGTLSSFLRQLNLPLLNIKMHKVLSVAVIASTLCNIVYLISCKLLNKDRWWTGREWGLAGHVSHVTVSKGALSYWISSTQQHVLIFRAVSFIFLCYLQCHPRDFQDEYLLPGHRKHNNLLRFLITMKPGSD